MVKKIFMVLVTLCVMMAAAAAEAAPGHGKGPHVQTYASRVDCSLSVDAGDDEDIDTDETVRLEGSVDGNYDDLDWDCSGGKLSDENILRPTYDPPANYGNDDEKTYTCTLTARNECGSDSDSVKINVDYETEPSNFRVVLRAKPQSDCAPSNNVDLTATLEDYGNRDYDYTYKFDCDNDGDYEKTVTTEDTSYTAGGLCDYHDAGGYTARVSVEGRKKTVSDTYIVHANDCGGGTTVTKKKTGRVSITKMVRNISRGTDYQGAVMASPSDVISYKIVVTAVSGDSDNVFVRDTMPSGLISTGGLQLDGISNAGNLFSGIDIGDLASGQTKTITYNAVVAAKDSFAFGSTALTNIATVIAGGSAANSSTAVNVYRSAVSGATAVPTGVGENAGETAGKNAMPAAALISAVLLWVILLAAKAEPLRRFSQNIR